YVLEYGNGYFKDNPEAELIRIEYNGGNRKPQVEASASKTAGAIPLSITLSSAGTHDFDEGDSLQYAWRITRNGVAFRQFNQANPSLTLTNPGTYQATLTVTDKSGAQNAKSVVIKAGNEPPVVTFAITKGNSSFFFPGKSIEYAVQVSDKEDGNLVNKTILPAQVSVSTNYLSEGYNLTRIAQNQLRVDASAQYATAISLINKSDCKSCHAVKEKVLGPSFRDVSLKYKGDPSAMASLAKKILQGGSGVWGDAFMPAHPTMAESDVKSITTYILSLSEAPRPAQRLPVQGTYKTDVASGATTEGSFIFRAAYTDRGAKAAAAQSSEMTVVLRSPTVPVAHASVAEDTNFTNDSSLAMTRSSGAFLGFTAIDLAGINQIELVRGPSRTGAAVQSGTIEVRLGGVGGQLLGTFSGEYRDKMIIPISTNTGSGQHNLYFIFNGSPVRIKSIRFSEDE
ncbi:PKD domain-containing protein, partial [Spirosoma flavum]